MADTGSFITLNAEYRDLKVLLPALSVRPLTYCIFFAAEGRIISTELSADAYAVCSTPLCLINQVDVVVNFIGMKVT